MADHRIETEKDSEERFQSRMGELREEFFAAVRESDREDGIGLDNDEMSVHHLLSTAIGQLIAVEANAEALSNRVRKLEGKPPIDYGLPSKPDGV